MKPFLMPAGTGFSTEDLAQHEKLGFWNDCVNEEFGQLECTPENNHTFQGQVQGHSLKAMTFSEVIADAQQVERNARHISKHGAEDGYKLVINLSGHAESKQHQHTGILKAGDYVIYDSGCPFSLVFKSAYHALTLQIPRQQFEKSLPHNSDHIGKIIDGSSGIGLLTARFIGSVASQISDFKGQMREEVIEQINQLISISLRSSFISEPNVKSRPIKKARLFQIKDFIEANLDNRNLSPTYIALHNKTSVRYLHKLFATTNLSLSRYILIRRLEYAKSQLDDIRYATVPLIEIAFLSGFKDSAHFSRAFKNQFGVSPSDYRKNSHT